MISPVTFRRSSSACCIAICALLAVIYPARNSQAQNLAETIVALDSPHSPLEQTQPQFSDSLRSLDMGKTQSLCVELSSDTGALRSLPIDLGSILRLSFRHSIYGSQVEEVFMLRSDGFQLARLRYSEARLVDFYGYENAKLENSTWIVTPKPALLPYLRLNMSSDAFMSLRFDPHANGKPRSIRPTGALRLTVAYCKSSAHG